jgi:hypothetical protein
MVTLPACCSVLIEQHVQELNSVLSKHRECWDSYILGYVSGGLPQPRPFERVEKGLG